MAETPSFRTQVPRGVRSSLISKKPRGWDKSPSLSIVFGLSSKTQWLSGLYYADFISFYSPTQLCGGGTTKSNSNELPISVPLSIFLYQKNVLKIQKSIYNSLSSQSKSIIMKKDGLCIKSQYVVIIFRLTYLI